MEEEQVIYEGRVPFRAIHFSHGLIWLVLLGWNVGLLASWLRTFGATLKITTQRVVLTEGVLSQEIEEVELYRVKDTALHQSFFQRLLGIGEITLFSGDATSPTLSFILHDPVAYREEIRTHVNECRRRMGAIQVD